MTFCIVSACVAPIICQSGLGDATMIYEKRLIVK